MYISRLLVRNFRNFRLLDVPLNDSATCIVGENNTGKTNLIHAIRLVLDANMSSYYRQLAPDDFSVGLDYRSPQHVLVSVEFREFADKPNEEAMVEGWHIDDDLARLTYRFLPKPKVREAILDGERADNDLTIDDYHWMIRGGGGEIDPATVAWDRDFGRGFRFEELQQSFLVILMKPLRDVEQELRQQRSSPLGRLLTAADIPPEEQDELVDILVNANQQISDSETISGLGTEISEAFEATAGKAFSMGVDVGMAAPSFMDIYRGLTLLLSNDAIDKFTPGKNGLGLNNVLYISILLRVFERRMEAGQKAGQLLLVEEPEAHLHPQLQRVLFNTLSEKGFQTIATTHSTHITSRVPIESVVVLTNDGTPATKSTVPNVDAKLSEREVLDLDRYLDATRGALLYARKVMLVEGPAELFLIPAIVKEVMGISLDERGITVVPIFGVHFDIYAKLFGPDAISKQCAIVADGDLVPSDAELIEDDEDISEIHKPDLATLQNDYVKVFTCPTTFERALVGQTTLPMFAAAAKEVGATRLGKRILKAESEIDWDDRDKVRVTNARDLVLRTAKQIGKARFAQVASKHIEGVTWLPRYLQKAVNWLSNE